MLYRKKPVEIEAKELKYNMDCIEEIIKWITFHGGTCRKGYDGSIIISTLEGDMVANTGSYIIKGVQGEFYPCKSDIFLATYEEVIL